jgi:glutamate-5-semialdehyde dehydrogenase
MEIRDRAAVAKFAGIKLAATSTEERNKGLRKIAEILEDNKDAIVKANKTDLERSEKENLEMPLLKRLKFDEGKIQGVIDGINSLMELEDPLGKVEMAKELDEGLNLYRVTCPIGVIGVIFESRPDAFVQIATLCLKSGNSVMLKGGREALETNRILGELIIKATEEAGLPSGWIQPVETRSDIKEMLAQDEYIDLIIPRGSNAFVKYIMENSDIPVMGHADGICHAYVDEKADLAMADTVVLDAKTQYLAVCNALETLLVNENVAETALPMLQKGLETAGVKLYGCEKTCQIIDVAQASEEDWKTEYLDLILSVKVVKDVDEAIDHINYYGSGHTDTIITDDKAAAEKFLTLVNSACVFHNCSTRFSDGFRFGFGAEVGVSTGKLHARGPVGLEGLVTYKYKLLGTGNIVADYASGDKTYTHKKIEEKYPN